MRQTPHLGGYRLLGYDLDDTLCRFPVFPEEKKSEMGEFNTL